MRGCLFCAVLVLGLGAAVGASAGDRDGGRGDDRSYGVRDFIGLWEAIDSSDGSTQRLSITCARRSDCDVRLNDTAFTLSCPNEIGFAQGQGSIKGHSLFVKLTLQCSGGGTFGPQDNWFVLDRRNGTLTNHNDDGLQFPNVFHKISE